MVLSAGPMPCLTAAHRHPAILTSPYLGSARATTSDTIAACPPLHRKSVVSGKIVSVSVDLAGRRIIKTKNRHNMTQIQSCHTTHDTPNASTPHHSTVHITP